MTFHPVLPAPPALATLAEPTNPGEAIFARPWVSNNSLSMVSQTMLLTYWTAVTNGVATSVITKSGDTAGATLTYAAVGIYSVDGSGNLTKLTDTGDLHATLWAGTFTGYTSALTPSFTRVIGQRYAVGYLVVGTTPPSLAGANPGSAFTSFETAAHRSAGSVSGQATLPASVTAAGVATGPNMPCAIVTP